jgi:ATP adenylyltransferase
MLCRSVEQASEKDSLVVHVAPLSFIVMNLYPYNAGHVMVAPRRHVGNLTDATPDELAEMMDLTRRLEAVMAEVYRPDGLNVGMNLGRAAGAGVPDHIHLHVVPRWSGDTNYMTVAGQTRVIPEDPGEAATRLRRHFDR